MWTKRVERDGVGFPAGQILLLALMLALGGCGILGGERGTPVASDPMGRFPVNDPNNRNLLGSSSSSGSASVAKSAPSGAGVGVNSFLWRASLDTLSFMPLASADPFGGVIITDWYASPTTPSERFKVTVYILDKRLRADALKVSVFRQQQNKGDWADASLDPDTPAKLENAILTRARQMRIATTDK